MSVASSTLSRFLRSALLALSAAVSAIGLCCACHAQTASSKPSLTSFEIVPISMMTDEQLIRSAQFTRENNIPTEKHLLNMMWLIEESDAAFGDHSRIRLFQERLEHYWDRTKTASPRFAGWLKLDNIRLVDRGHTSYRLKMGDDKVALQYRYSF